MRKIIRRLLAVVLSIVVVFSSAPIYASAATQKSSYPDEKTSLTESLQKQLEEGTIGNSKESKSKLKTYDPEQFVTIIVELKNHRFGKRKRDSRPPGRATWMVCSFQSMLR
jgi:hypothetical protein